MLFQSNCKKSDTVNDLERLRRCLSVGLGVLIFLMGVFMIIRDYDYILTGNTVNLNDVLENDKAVPRSKYVTYTCNASLGNYAETQIYVKEIIPTPIKIQRYALLTDNNVVISAEIRGKSKLEEIDRLVEDTFSLEEDAEPEPVVLVGYFSSNSYEMDNLLDEYLSELGDLSEMGVTVTSYKIDTTKTRGGAAALDLFVLVVSVGMVVISVRKLKDLAY